MKFPLITCMALLASVAGLRAEPALLVTQGNVASRVRAQNPELAAARLRIDEALGNLKQSGKLVNPEAGSSFEHTPRLREGKIELELAQKFPLTDRLEWEKGISVLQVKVAEAEVREVERTLVSQAKVKVVKYLCIQEKRAMLAEQNGLANEFSSFLTAAASKGEASVLDAGQAKLDAATAIVETHLLEAEATVLLGELKQLLGMRTGAPLQVGGRLTHPTSRQPIPQGKSPDLEAARLNAQAAERTVMLEKARKYDDVEVGVFAAGERREDAPSGYQNEAMLGFRFRFSLPLWNRNEGATEAAQARHLRMKKEATALHQSIQLEVEAAKKEMQEWGKLLTELDEVLLPLAEEQLQAADKAFRSGQGEIQNIFRSRTHHTHLALSRLDALRGFHLAQIRFQNAKGNF